MQTILEEYINFVVQCAGPEESAVKSGIQGLELRGEKENLTKAKVGEFRILYFVFILFSLFEPRITEKTSTLKLKIDVESCSDTSVPSQYHSIVKLNYSTARNSSQRSWRAVVCENAPLKTKISPLSGAFHGFFSLQLLAFISLALAL